MVLEAIDLLFAKLKHKHNFPFDKVRAISGCGQQHAAVYWKKGSEKALAHLDCSSDGGCDGDGNSNNLKEKLKDCFVIQDCPIWMDTSTTLECDERETVFGGATKVAEVTGSR